MHAATGSPDAQRARASCGWPPRARSEVYDVVITFEGRVMEAVEECLNARCAHGGDEMAHTDAKVKRQRMFDLCQVLRCKVK